MLVASLVVLVVARWIQAPDPALAGFLLVALLVLVAVTWWGRRIATLRRVLFGVTAALLLGVASRYHLRLVALATVRHARRQWGLADATLILGAGVVGRALAEAMLESPELGLRPVGFIDPDPRTGRDSEVPVLSRSRSDLSAVIDHHGVRTDGYQASARGSKKSSPGSVTSCWMNL